MLFLQSHPHKYFTITPLPGEQYQHKMSHKYSSAWRAVPTQDVSQALCCLEGSTLSNLVQRRRRCARIVLNQILLPGGQYARGQGRSFHQTKETIVVPEPPFLLSRTGLAISSPVLPISDANVCNRSRKRLRPSS